MLPGSIVRWLKFSTWNRKIKMTRLKSSLRSTIRWLTPQLEELINRPDLAPIDLGGSGYSIARKKTKDGTDIRINCVSGENGEFADNVMYANVTGTGYYVKVQVARTNGEMIDGEKRDAGDIVIFKNLHNRAEVGAEMTDDKMNSISEADKKTIASCNIIANAVIKDKILEEANQVKISSSVRFKGKTFDQKVANKSKDKVLVGSKDRQSNGKSGEQTKVAVNQIQL